MSKYHIKCTDTDSDKPKKKAKKVPTGKPPPPQPEPPKEDEAVLIANFNSNLPCCCEVVSRALREDLPKILGMSSRRAALQIGRDDLLDCNPDIQFKEPGESDTNESEKAECAMPPKEKK